MGVETKEDQVLFLGVSSIVSSGDAAAFRRLAAID
jgi:hypothetical protein